MKLLILLLFPTLCLSQKDGDTKIIITLSSEEGVYRKVKLALINSDFIIKDDENKDTLTTYPNEIENLPGQSVLKAAISGNVVTLYGFFGLKRLNDWGYYNVSKDYKNIFYFKGSKGWKQMAKVANSIGNNIIFTK